MVLAFDLQRIGVGSKINGAPRTPNLAADRTNAQLRLGVMSAITMSRGWVCSSRTYLVRYGCA